MAQTVQITPEAQGRTRNGWAVLGLSIITLGIYGVFWTYTLHRELRDIGRARGDDELGSLNPAISTVSLYLGWILIVPPFVTYWRLGGRVNRAQELTGAPRRIGQMNTFLLIVPGSMLLIPALYWFHHVQMNHNASLESVASPAVEASLAPPVVAPATAGDPLGG